MANDTPIFGNDKSGAVVRDTGENQESEGKKLWNMLSGHRKG